jgi:heme/copper-type cytochrome/quinol oxidase subunit 3
MVNPLARYKMLLLNMFVLCFIVGINYVKIEHNGIRSLNNYLTNSVVGNNSFGIVLFLVSEICCFLGLFIGFLYFDSSNENSVLMSELRTTLNFRNDCMVVILSESLYDYKLLNVLNVDVPVFYEYNSISSSTGLTMTALLFVSGATIHVSYRYYSIGYLLPFYVYTICSLLGTILFLNLQFIEFSELRFSTNKAIYSCFFLITGLHLVHVLLATLLLVAIFNSEIGSYNDHSLIRLSFSYFQMVDAVWLIVWFLCYVCSNSAIL